MTEAQLNPFPWVGRMLGDGAIEVLEGIGRGGQGAVYKVRIDPVKYILSCIITGQSDPNDLDTSIFEKSDNSEEQVREAQNIIKKRLASITKTGQFKMVRNLSSEDVSPYKRPVGGSKNIEDIFCAMKIIHTKNKYGVIDEDKVNRFFREIEIMKQLENIHIPDSLGDFQEDDYIYHLTEFIDAKIKFDEIEKPISQKLIVHVAEGVSDALVYAHKKIIHRDIKPANILMDHEDMIKVLDFGTAKFNEDMNVSHQGDLLMTATNTVLGTVHFFSPEQARGDKVGKPSDIYSLGATLYYLVSGEYPRNESEYLRNNPQSIMHNILHRKPEPLTDELDPLLKKIIMRMIANDPDKRPNAEQVHRMIYNFHTKVPIETWDSELLKVLDKNNIENDVTPTEQIDFTTNEYVSTKQVKNWLKIGAVGIAFVIAGMLFLISFLRSERGKEADSRIVELISILKTNIDQEKNAETETLFKELEVLQEELTGKQAKDVRAVWGQMKTIDDLDRNLDLLETSTEIGDFKSGDIQLEKINGIFVSEKVNIVDAKLTPLFETLDKRFSSSKDAYHEKKTVTKVGALLTTAEDEAGSGNYTDANSTLKQASELFSEYSKKPEYKVYQSRIGRLTALLLSKSSAINDYKTAENILDEQFNLLYDPILVRVKEGKGVDEKDIKKLREQLELAEDKLDDAGNIVTSEKRNEAKTKLDNHYSRIAHLYALNFEITVLKVLEKAYIKAGMDLAENIPMTEAALKKLADDWEETQDELKRIRKRAGDEYETLQKRVTDLKSIFELPRKNSKVAAGLFKKVMAKGDVENASYYLPLIHSSERKEMDDYIDVYSLELKIREKPHAELHKKAEELYLKLQLEKRAEYHKIKYLKLQKLPE